MTKEKMIQEVGKPILRTIGFIQLILIITLFSSVFIWIWGTWDLAWKIGLSAFIGICITALVYRVAKDLISQSVDKSLNDNNPTKSNFQKRLEALQEQKLNQSKNENA